ncbi:MAG: porin [Rubrivivax sp.]
MKKSLIALAVLAAAGSASAQSSVTLFGVVDIGVRQVDNAGTKQSQLSTDGMQASRLGLRGTEDLGGGLSAGFWLESAINPDTGTSNATRFWHRRATVSLSSASLGEIRLGRDLTPTWNALADFDVFGVVGVGDTSLTYAALGGVDTRARADNMVSYFLPSTLGGVYGQVSAAAGEGVAGKKYTGGRVGYRAGPLDVNLAYGQTEVTTDDVKLTVFGAAYDFGVVKLSGSFQEADYQSAKDRHYNIGVSAPFGASLVRASYSKAEGKGTLDGRDADQIALGYVHNLSKRTAVYTTYAVIDNKGSANYTVGTINGFTMPKNQEKSQGFEAGIRHAF